MHVAALARCGSTTSFGFARDKGCLELRDLVGERGGTPAQVFHVQLVVVEHLGIGRTNQAAARLVGFEGGVGFVELRGFALQQHLQSFAHHFG